MIISEWRVYCTDTESDEYIWGFTQPTECPGHTIDPTKTAKMREVVVEPKVAYTPNNYTLQQAKDLWFFQIDERTAQLIGLGYTYDSTQFSLSLPSQIKMLGIHQVRDDPAMTYPIDWNTKDDAAVYEVADSATVHAMFLTGLGTYRAHVDSGTALKNQVRAATTVAEVEAVTDPR